MMEGHRVKLTEVNPYLVCVLCHGYLVDATTIAECLHSFCRSCIFRQLERKPICPICETQVHNTKLYRSLRPDKTLQDIVYKLVPGLFHNEMQRRRDFYKNHPYRDEHLEPECRGVGLDRLIYSPEDLISLSLEFYDEEREKEEWSNQGSPKPAQTAPSGPKRYLQCPSGFKMRHLKKFLRQKYGLSPTFNIDILYKRETLPDSYSLMDVAYIYTWKRNSPMRFYYRMPEVVMKQLMIPPPEVPLIAEVEPEKKAESPALEAVSEEKKTAEGKPMGTDDTKSETQTAEVKKVDPVVSSTNEATELGKTNSLESNKAAAQNGVISLSKQDELPVSVLLSLGQSRVEDKTSDHKFLVPPLPTKNGLVDKTTNGKVGPKYSVNKIAKELAASKAQGNQIPLKENTQLSPSQVVPQQILPKQKQLHIQKQNYYQKQKQLQIKQQKQQQLNQQKQQQLQLKQQQLAQQKQQIQHIIHQQQLQHQLQQQQLQQFHQQQLQQLQTQQQLQAQQPIHLLQQHALVQQQQIPIMQQVLQVQQCVQTPQVQTLLQPQPVHISSPQNNQHQTMNQHQSQIVNAIQKDAVSSLQQQMTQKENKVKSVNGAPQSPAAPLSQMNPLQITQQVQSVSTLQGAASLPMSQNKTPPPQVRKPTPPPPGQQPTPLPPVQQPTSQPLANPSPLATPPALATPPPLTTPPPAQASSSPLPKYQSLPQAKPASPKTQLTKDTPPKSPKLPPQIVSNNAKAESADKKAAAPSSVQASSQFQSNLNLMSGGKVNMPVNSSQPKSPQVANNAQQQKPWQEISRTEAPTLNGSPKPKTPQVTLNTSNGSLTIMAQPKTPQGVTSPLPASPDSTAVINGKPTESPRPQGIHQNLPRTVLPKTPLVNGKAYQKAVPQKNISGQRLNNNVPEMKNGLIQQSNINNRLPTFQKSVSARKGGIPGAVVSKTGPTLDQRIQQLYNSGQANKPSSPGDGAKQESRLANWLNNRFKTPQSPKEEADANATSPKTEVSVMRYKRKLAELQKDCEITQENPRPDDSKRRREVMPDVSIELMRAADMKKLEGGKKEKRPMPGLKSIQEVGGKKRKEDDSVLDLSAAKPGDGLRPALPWLLNRPPHFIPRPT